MLKPLTLAAFATVAQAGEAPVATGKLGGQTYLMDAVNHMTLYTFDKDSKGVSNCYDDCAAKWPPVFGDADMSLLIGRMAYGIMRWSGRLTGIK